MAVRAGDNLSKYKTTFFLFGLILMIFIVIAVYNTILIPVVFAMPGGLFIGQQVVCAVTLILRLIDSK